MTLVEEIRKAGLWDEGYCIQQDPEELAALIYCLEANAKPGSYLAIGIAAGGVERLISNTLSGIKRLFVMDDGKHPQHGLWKSAVDDLPVHVFEYSGDSHSKAATEWLALMGEKFTVVGIDGDHSPQGVAQDWELVQPYLAPGALVWFHDIHVSEPGQTGARKLWARLKTEHEVLRETNGQFGIGAIRV